MVTKVMSLDAALDAAFTTKPVKKQIEVDGNKFNVWVKPASYEHVVDVLSQERSSERVAKLICTSIVNEKGEAVFTYEDVVGTATEKRGPLNNMYTVALLGVIHEVTLGKPLTKSNSAK